MRYIDVLEDHTVVSIVHWIIKSKILVNNFAIIYKLNVNIFFLKKEKQVIIWFDFVLLLRRAFKQKSSLKSDVGQN